MSVYRCLDCGLCFSDSSYDGRGCVCGGPTTRIPLSKTLNLDKLFEKLFEEKLKILCQSYDYKYGSYPESYYEGKAIYEFCLESQNEQNDQKNKSSVNFDEPYDVFVEDWEKS